MQKQQSSNTQSFPAPVAKPINTKVTLKVVLKKIRNPRKLPKRNLQREPSEQELHENLAVGFGKSSSSNAT